MSLVNGADERVVFLLRRCDDVDVGLDRIGEHAARVAMAGMIVDHEVLRKELQDHAVFLKLNFGSALESRVDVGLRDLARTAEFEFAARVRAADGSSTKACCDGFNENLRGGFGLLNSGEDAVRNGLLIGDAALDPALGFNGSTAEESHAIVFEGANDAASVTAPYIKSYGDERFGAHGVIVR